MRKRSNEILDYFYDFNYHNILGEFEKIQWISMCVLYFQNIFRYFYKFIRIFMEERISASRCRSYDKVFSFFRVILIQVYKNPVQVYVSR